jgi:uncharacterized protein DUF6580
MGEVRMLAYLFVVLAVTVRVLSGAGYLGTMGFTPVAASLLFFGSRMSRKQFVVPVALLIGSDLFLNYRIYGYPLSWDQTVVWAWYLGACFLGTLLRNRVKPLYVGATALGSSVSFFLISNFAVWLAGNLGYAKNLGGLFACYVAAIPFFRNDLLSNLVFSTVFFGLPALLAQGRGAVEEKSTAA